MDMFGSFFSPSGYLNEQIARQMFDILPDSDLVVTIIDRNNHRWPSDSESFSKLNLSETLLADLCDRIDDGDESVITETDSCSLIASVLSTDKTNCGYVIIAIPQGPETTLANIGLFEVIFSQFNLIAKLIEKNNLLYELQIKNNSVYGQKVCCVN